MKKRFLLCILVTAFACTMQAMKRKADDDIAPPAKKINRKFGQLSLKDLLKPKKYPPTALTKLIIDNGGPTEDYLVEIFKFFGANDLARISCMNKLTKQTVDRLLAYQFGKNITLRKMSCIEPEVLEIYLSAFYDKDRTNVSYAQNFKTRKIKQEEKRFCFKNHFSIYFDDFSSNFEKPTANSNEIIEQNARKAYLSAIEANKTSIQKELEKRFPQAKPKANLTKDEIQLEIPLTWLAQCGLFNTFKKYAEKTVVDSCWITPSFKAAAENGHLDVVIYLANNFKEKLFDCSICYFEIDPKNYSKGTTLCKTAAAGHADVVQFLLENFFDKTSDDDGTTVGVALEKATKNGHCKVIQCLAKKFSGNMCFDIFQKSVLKLAAKYKKTTTIVTLLNTFEYSQEFLNSVFKK